MVVVRSHTAENVAPAVRSLKAAFDTGYPQRLTSTQGHDADGIWPSEAHTIASPASDHEGGNALDIDDDLSGTDGTGASVTPEMCRIISMDARANYVIHDAKLWRDGIPHAYTGSNAHTGHAHISIWESKRDDDRPWDIGQEEEMLPLDYRHLSITDMGEPAHRAYLKGEAAKMGLSIKEGANTFYVDAEKGAKADVFISYAKAHGLDCESVNTYKGQAVTMNLRLKGIPAPVDAECVAQLAAANEKIRKAKAALT